MKRALLFFPFAFFLFPYAARAARGEVRPVVITTDCGADMDDQWAIAYMLLSPQIEVKGIVTTHAPNLKPPASETSAACARQIVHDFLHSRIPVFAGSPVPLDHHPRALMNDGVRFILDMAQGYSEKNRLAVVAIGAATDIASALLADASLSHRIEIVAMGFQDWPNGGEEFNIKNDVAAYRIILDSSVPLAVGSAAVTRQYLRMDIPKSRQLTAMGGPLGEFLARIFETWVNKHPDLVAHEAGPRQWIIWDVVTAAYLQDLTQWKEVPRPVLNDDITFDHPQTPQKIRWITFIDAAYVWSDFTRKLTRSP